MATRPLNLKLLDLYDREQVIYSYELQTKNI